MKKILFNMLIAVAAISIFASCTALFPEGENAIRIDATEYSVPAEGGEVQIKFVPVLAWTAACEEEWLTFSPASGDASAEEVIMTLSADSNGLSMRTAEIILSTSAGEVTITLIQESVGLDSLFQQTEYDVPVEGDEIKIKFTAPVDWIAECEEDWISLSPESGKASTKKKTLAVAVDSNEGGKSRTAHVYIIFGDDTVEIKIRQEGDSSDNSGGSDDTNAPTDPSGPNDDGSYSEPAKKFEFEVIEDNGNARNFYVLGDDGRMQVFKDIYLKAGTQWRLWDAAESKAYGCPSDYIRSSYKTNTRVNVEECESWFIVDFDGYYDVYADPLDCSVFVMTSGRTPYDLPAMEHVLHETYDSIKTTGEEELVMVHGVVMGKNRFSYILAIDGRYYNNVLIYDPDDLLNFKLGSCVDLYASAKNYNGLKELCVDENMCWYSVMYDQEWDYDAETPIRIERMSSYDSSSYDYVSVIGRLEIGTEASGKPSYTVVVDGPEPFNVLISQPLQDLSQFDGKNVLVEGYHMGRNMSEYQGMTVPTLKIMLKRIWNADSISGGSTEDVLPGGSITVTNN